MGLSLRERAMSLVASLDVSPVSSPKLPKFPTKDACRLHCSKHLLNAQTGALLGIWMRACDMFLHHGAFYQPVLHLGMDKNKTLGLRRLEALVHLPRCYFGIPLF